MKSSIIKLSAAAILAVFSSFALTSCGDTHEKAMKDMISVLNRTADTLDTIKDKATAEAAKPKLQALSEEMKTLKGRMDKLGEPKGDAQDALKAKYETEMQATMKHFMQASMKAAAAAPEAAEALKSFQMGMP